MSEQDSAKPQKVRNVIKKPMKEVKENLHRFDNLIETNNIAKMKKDKDATNKSSS